MATALNEHIGYDKAATIVKKSADSGRMLRTVPRPAEASVGRRWDCGVRPRAVIEPTQRRDAASDRAKLTSIIALTSLDPRTGLAVTRTLFFTSPFKAPCNVTASEASTAIRTALRTVIRRPSRASESKSAVGAPAGVAEVRAWLRRDDGDDASMLDLLVFADALPPVTFDLGLMGWVPTVELTVLLRALPAPGWVRAVQRARLLQDGWLDEECELWDSEGRLVAQARQLAGYRVPEGWTPPAG